MQSNFSKENVVFEDSTMMEVCYELCHSDSLQQTDVWFQADMQLILYLLCKKSSKNAKALAKTFGEEDEKIIKSQTTILDAFGKCVPDFGSSDIIEVLACLPEDVPSRSTILKNTRNRYQRYKAARRFSAPLMHILNDWKVHPESDVQHPQPLPESSLPMQSAVVYPEFDYQYPSFAYHEWQPVSNRGHQQEGFKLLSVVEILDEWQLQWDECPKSDFQDPASAYQDWRRWRHDVRAVSSELVEKYRFCSLKAVEEHYKVLQENLADQHIRVENSIMLRVCYGLSKRNCFQGAPLLVQIDIKTILYLLCQESSRNAKALADTFREEDKKVKNDQTTMFQAFGRCVPEMQDQEVSDVLSDFPSQDVLEDLSRFPEKTKREDIVENIRTRYKNNKGLERFHPFLENVDLVVWSDVIYPLLENVDLVVWNGVIYPPLMHQCQQPLPSPTNDAWKHVSYAPMQYDPVYGSYFPMQ